MIVSQAEIRVALGIAASITEDERAIIELLHGQAEGAIRSFLKYDPVQAERAEYYPRARAPEPRQTAEGIYESNRTRAVWTAYGNATELILGRLPVRSVASVYIDEDANYGQRSGAFPVASLLTAGDDYWLDLEQAGLCGSGILHGASTWPITPGSIEVTYTAGYTATEFAGRSDEGIDASPIKLATLITVCEAIKSFLTSRKHSQAGWIAGRMSSEHLGEYSYSLDGAASAAVSAFQIAVPPSAQMRLQPFVHYGDMTL